MKPGIFLFLTKDNLLSYLTSFQGRLPFHIVDVEKIEEVNEYSNNNYLFRIILVSGDTYYLKQAQPHNRRSMLEGKPQAINSARAIGEVSLLRFLKSHWGKDTVPRVYFFDRRNYAFLMSDVSQHGKLLINEFSKNRVHPELARVLGKNLGLLHALTYKKPNAVAIDRRYEKFMKGFFYNYYWGFAARKLVGRSAVDGFYRQVARAPQAIIWGDPVHRNIFVKPDGKISCIDFDHTVEYDPMHDLGVLLAHWVWMAIRGNKRIKAQSEKFLVECSRAYWQAWRKQTKLTTQEKAEMLKRLPKWMGIYLLSRTDGKSGSYFKKSPAWEKRIRQLSISLFRGQDNDLTKRMKRLILEV